MKQTRLEALKLANSLGGDPREIIDMAEMFTKYIEEGPVEKVDPRRIKRKRNQKEKTHGPKT